MTHVADSPKGVLHIPHLARALPKGWNWQRLDDVCNGVFDCPHSTPVLTTDGPFVVRTQDVITGTFRAHQAARVSEETYADRIRRAEPTYGDLLFSREGTYFGIAAEVPINTRVCLGQRMVLLRPQADIMDPRFLKYWLNSPILAGHVQGQRDGTVAERLNMPTIRALPVPVAPLTQQRRIGSILGTLDDKIELNRRMNETLEAMARRLFKSWFIDFDPVHAKAALRREHPKLSNADLSRRALPNMAPTIAELFPDTFEDSTLGLIPKGWKVSVLDDMTEMVIGGDWGKDIPCDEFSTGVFCIRGADIPDLQASGLGKMPTRYLKPSSVLKRGMRVGDLAFEISGGSPTQSTGRPVLITQLLLESLNAPLTCSNFCRLIRLTESRMSSFLYYYLRHLYDADEFLQYENGTTGIKNFAFTTFSSLHRFVVPTSSLTAAFASLVQNTLAKRSVNGQESRRLAQTRDRLLPRLLSGELKLD